MTHVIKVPRSDTIDKIERAIENLPLREGELSISMMNDLFPLLDMDVWIEEMLLSLPIGSITTFGNIASALGTKWASRAVGERIASGDIKGPLHRVVYSDGRVPQRSVNKLSEELKLRNKGDDHFIIDVEPSLVEKEKHPLAMLSALQDRMGPMLKEEKNPKISKIAGMDISSKDNIHAAALTTMDLEGDHIEDLCIKGEPGLPYIPGFLFYREAPLFLPLLQKAGDIIDNETLFVLDGNGVLHPRRMGIACQIGIASGYRTCGVAKKLLMGKISGTNKDVSSLLDVMDRDEVIGSAIKKGGSKPVYLSRGHRIDQGTVNRIISGLTWTRVPEPTKRAHELSNRCRRSETPS